jgi:ribosomal protein S18 acetylase RimI-like enzyme
VTRGRDLPAALTDDRLRGPRTRVVERGRYRVIRTPTRPSYHEGNQLSLDAPPAASEVEAWLETCRRELADVAIARLLIQWEVPVGVDLGPAERVRAVMTADAVRAVDAPEGVRLGEVAADDDAGWRDLTALHVADGAPMGEAYAAFARTHMAAYRDLARAGLGVRAWGAWIGDAMVATCLIHEAPDWLRVEEVITDAAYRRRGIAAALCSAAYAAGAARHPRARLLIVADADGDAERIYARLGFVRTGLQGAIERPAGR